MKALLSIKPEFASLIFNKTKKFEYRRSIFKQPIERIVVYASAPISMVIGEFEVEDIFCENLNKLWRLTKEHSGISQQYFRKYFANREKGYAIKVGKVIKYKEPWCLRQSFNLTPPQSFQYLTCPINYVNEKQNLSFRVYN
jgi:predicted transcriptional regulator